MKSFSSSLFVVVFLFGCSVISSTKMPYITKFWLKYGPELIDPQTYRCMVQVIDIASRSEGKSTLRRVRITLFENKTDKVIADLDENVLLPFQVDLRTTWYVNKLDVTIIEKGTNNVSFKRTLVFTLSP